MSISRPHNHNETPMPRMLRFSFPLVGIGLIVGGVFVDPKVMTDDGLMRARTLLFLLGGFFTVLPFALQLLIHRATQQMRQREQFFSENGIESTATVLSYDRTGALVNHNPELAFDLRVVTDSGREFSTEVEQVVGLEDLPKLREGMELPAYVHPENEDEVWIDWSQAEHGRPV